MTETTTTINPQAEPAWVGPAIESTTTTNPQAEPAWVGPAILLAGGICIGFAPILLRYGVGDGGEDMLGPQAVAFWRYIFAIPMLVALSFIVNKRLPFKPNRYVILAGTFFAIDIGLWHWGLTLTTVANSTFLVGLGNLLVGITACCDCIGRRSHAVTRRAG